LTNQTNHQAGISTNQSIKQTAIQTNQTNHQTNISTNQSTINQSINRLHTDQSNKSPGRHINKPINDQLINQTDCHIDQSKKLPGRLTNQPINDQPITRITDDKTSRQTPHPAYTVGICG
jgi:hypothetical protein